MLALAFWLAYIVRFQIAGRMIPAWNEPRLDYLMFGSAAIVVMLGIFWIAQLYDYQLLTNDSVEYPNVIYACFFGALAMIFLGFFVAPFGDMMSRGWVAAAWTFSILLVSGSRYVVRKIWHRLAINGYPLAQVLILGTEAESLQLYRRLMESQRSVLEVVGFVDIRGKRPSGNKWPLPAPQGLPLLDVGVDKLQQVLLRHRIDEVIIVSELKRVDFANVLYVADQENVRVRALLHSDEMFSRRRSGSLGLAHTPLVMVNSLSLNPFHKTVKRGFDLVVAGLGLLAFSPLWALVAVHCMLDRVPLLDGDEIIGMDEKPFHMFRFNVYGDESWFGQFLRNTRLCKVPRLLNVLRGEMSIVGPEALPASRKDLLKKYEFMPLTLRVRPGLTGTWCIVDREEQTVIEKIRLDMYYLSHYSFLKDLDIFFIRTVPKFPGVLAGGIQAPKLVEEKASNGSYQTPASAT